MEPIFGASQTGELFLGDAKNADRRLSIFRLITFSILAIWPCWTDAWLDQFALLEAAPAQDCGHHC
jgi:hypothetical protein